MWWERNRVIFQNLYILVEVVAGLIVKLAGENKSNYKCKNIRNPMMSQLLEGV
jgi:hypothetical protein